MQPARSISSSPARTRATPLRTSPEAGVVVEGAFTPDEAAHLHARLEPVAEAARTRLHDDAGSILHLHAFRANGRRYFIAQALAERRQVRWADDLDELAAQARGLLETRTA